MRDTIGYNYCHYKISYGVEYNYTNMSAVFMVREELIKKSILVEISIRGGWVGLCRADFL